MKYYLDLMERKKTLIIVCEVAVDGKFKGCAGYYK